MKNAFTEYTFNNGAVLKNRLVLAPMTTYSSNDDLTLSDEEEVYYNARAKQFGMIVTAATAVSKNAQAFKNQISIRDQRYLNSMKRLAKSITKEGSKAILQLHHGGRMNAPGLYVNQDIVAPSAVPAARDNAVTPRELKTSEVYDILDYFTNATKLAIRAGFDGVEIHGANTYLVQQFFSPHSNRRDDEFGGSLENRLRFPIELVERIIEVKKKYASKEFIIGYRFSSEELEEPGISLKDTHLLVDELASRELDYLHISAGKYNQSSIKDLEDKTPIAKGLLKVIDKRVPLIGVGGIETKENIEDALNLGYELAAIGFISLSDTQIVDHLRDGITPKKVVNKESLLPTNLYNILGKWLQNNDRGYTIE